MEELTKIKNRQLAIADEMLHASRNPALDRKALNSRIIEYRSQLLATTRDLEKAIANLDPDMTIPMEALG